MFFVPLFDGHYKMQRRISSHSFVRFFPWLIHLLLIYSYRSKIVERYVSDILTSRYLSHLSFLLIYSPFLVLSDLLFSLVLFLKNKQVSKIMTKISSCIFFQKLNVDRATFFLTCFHLDTTRYRILFIFISMTKMSIHENSTSIRNVFIFLLSIIVDC